MRARVGTLLIVAIATLLGISWAGQALADKPDSPASAELVVTAHQGKLLRTGVDIYRTHVADESICRVSAITPRELSIIGQKAGVTDVTVWLRDGRHQPVPLRVRVVGN